MAEILRSIADLNNNPCKFKLKDLPGTATTQQNTIIENGVKKVKRTVQKTDENGNLLFKTIQVKKSGGCGCKGKKVEYEEKSVPDTVEVWVEVPIQEQTTQQNTEKPAQVLCKLYGTIPITYCQRCKTYQK